MNILFQKHIVLTESIPKILFVYRIPISESLKIIKDNSGISKVQGSRKKNVGAGKNTIFIVFEFGFFSVHPNKWLPAPIITGKDHFTSFKNDFWITLFEIFPKHTFRNIFDKFQIYHSENQKNVFWNFFQNSFLPSKFLSLETDFAYETPILETPFLTEPLFHNHSKLSKIIRVFQRMQECRKKKLQGCRKKYSLRFLTLPV